MNKNCFFILIASFFIAGFILLALPNETFSQDLGCCQNQSNGKCVSGNNGKPDECPPNFYFPNVPFCAGGSGSLDDPACGPAGCCVIAQGNCEDVPPAESSCSDFRPNLFCDEIDECQPVTGCCVSSGDPVTCTIAENSDACDVDWQANVACDDDACSDEGPLGCCPPTVGQNNCADMVIEEECADDKVWVEGETCNDLDPKTCGQAGCCQFDLTTLAPPDPGASCDESNFATCDRGGGRWIADDICNTSGVCESLSIGCCVFAPNDCYETSEGACREQRGLFKGQDVLCSEVAQCNIVISPIPTLNQWGLIAMAGLLGLFSLFIIIRRHRYNVS
jgi:hypothetical protein